MCVRMNVNPQESRLMKVTTEMESHEQKGKGETVQEADFALDLTDSKVHISWDVFFLKFGGHVLRV